MKLYFSTIRVALPNTEVLTYWESGHPDEYDVQELFARSGHNWAHVPRDWDAPCKINFHNLRTGHAFSSGRLGYDTLERSFLGI